MKKCKLTKSSYNTIKDRYKYDVGYSEQKETIKNTYASTFGKKEFIEKSN